MHKGVLLLTKARNAAEAVDHVHAFLEPYSEYYYPQKPNTVYDWYEIGGRWSGTLVLDQLDQEKLKALQHEIDEQKLEWISPGGSQISRDQKTQKIQELFLRYFPEFEGRPLPIGALDRYYDVMPLSECLPAVHQWQDGFLRKVALKKEEIKQTLELGSEPPDWEVMLLDDYENERFTHCSNVHNIEENNQRIPEDPTDWWVVVIDMHF